MRHSKRFRTLAVLAAFASAATTASAVHRRAFVTSVDGTGNLGSWPEAGGKTGLLAGNEICRTLAVAAGLPNGSGYRAWLSTTTTDAYCMIQTLGGKKATGCGGGPQVGGGPWYQANGATAFTGSLTELTGPERVIYRAQLWDENLDPIPSDARIWTGTSATGEYLNGDCSGWTDGTTNSIANHGIPEATARDWTSAGTTSCSAPGHRLLCLEPGTGDPPAPFWSPASLVFVTSETGPASLGGWPEAGAATGVEAGDAICRSLAATARLPAPESFVAWLSTSAQGATERVTSNGVFKRVDGFTVASSPAQLLDGQLSVSIHVDESGRYLDSSGYPVFTGTLADGGPSGDACEDWAEPVSEGEGTRGDLSRASSAWTDDDAVICDYPGRLYCVSNVVTIFWDGFDYTGDASRWSDEVGTP